jgi:hypothetical protein
VRGIAAVIAALTLVSCASSPPATRSAVAIDLPEIERVQAADVGCAGAAPVVIVRIDPSADPPAWFELAGQRMDVRWPTGFRVVTDPVVIIDAQGAIVLRDDEEREVEMCATARDGEVEFAGAP